MPTLLFFASWPSLSKLSFNSKMDSMEAKQKYVTQNVHTPQLINSRERLVIGILGQVWYLIVSIPDLCTLIYIYSDGTTAASSDDYVLILG